MVAAVSVVGRVYPGADGLVLGFLLSPAGVVVGTVVGANSGSSLKELRKQKMPCKQFSPSIRCCH